LVQSNRDAKAVDPKAEKGFRWKVPRKLEFSLPELAKKGTRSIRHRSRPVVALFTR
jgi:hypothetical protein